MSITMALEDFLPLIFFTTIRERVLHMHLLHQYYMRAKVVLPERIVQRQ